MHSKLLWLELIQMWVPLGLKHFRVSMTRNLCLNHQETGQPNATSESKFPLFGTGFWISLIPQNGSGPLKLGIRVNSDPEVFRYSSP